MNLYSKKGSHSEDLLSAPYSTVWGAVGGGGGDGGGARTPLPHPDSASTPDNLISICCSQKSLVKPKASMSGRRSDHGSSSTAQVSPAAWVFISWRLASKYLGLKEESEPTWPGSSESDRLDSV